MIDFENGTYSPFSLELNLQGLTNWEVGDFGGKDNYELMGDPTSGGGGFKSSILVIPCVYKDVELKALYRPSDCWEGPLALRVQDMSDSYFLWAGSSRDMLEIVYEHAGNRNYLVQKDKWDDGSTIDITPDTWYHVQFRALGATLTGSVQQLDNQFQPIAGRFAEVTVVDSNLTQGYVGTRSAAGSNNLPYLIDDYQVINLDPSPVEENGSDEVKSLPQTFVLEQNYPNPFNPKTAFRYQLSASSQVELTIYNLLGEKVITLVSERQPAGSYKIEWDSSGFASGIYLYRMIAGNFVQTKKMVVLK
jgi:hypothetical protein